MISYQSLLLSTIVLNDMKNRGFIVLLLVYFRILVNLLADDINNMIGCTTD